MDNVHWGKTRFSGHKQSWHIVRGLTTAVCGRILDPSSIREDRPGNEKTCETCLRLVAPR